MFCTGKVLFLAFVRVCDLCDGKIMRSEGFSKSFCASIINCNVYSCGMNFSVVL